VENKDKRGTGPQDKTRRGGAQCRQVLLVEGSTFGRPEGKEEIQTRQKEKSRKESALFASQKKREHKKESVPKAGKVITCENLSKTQHSQSFS